MERMGEQDEWRAMRNGTARVRVYKQCSGEWTDRLEFGPFEGPPSQLWIGNLVRECTLVGKPSCRISSIYTDVEGFENKFC